MTGRFERLGSRSRRALGAGTGDRRLFCRSILYKKYILTVPLLCWRWLQVERAHQVERGGAQAQAVQRGPQVDHVPLLLTTRVKAVEDVLPQGHAEGAVAAVGAMNRTGAAFLRAGAA